MNFDDDESDNIWARPSPPIASSSAGQQLGADSRNIDNLNGAKKANDEHGRDDNAWDEGDEGEDGEVDFIDAASKLSLRNRARDGVVNEEISAPKTAMATDIQPANDSAPEAGPSSGRPFPGIPSNTIADTEGQFDDFPDDDNNNNDDDDGFGDFGHTNATKGGDDDDDDFGAFDEAQPNADFSFEQAPVASTSSQPMQDRPLSPHSRVLALPQGGFIDFAKDSSYDVVWPQIRALLEAADPHFWDSIIPDGPVETPAKPPEICETDEEKSMLQFLRSPIPIADFDWRRSQTRLKMLRALGKPIDLDDVAPAKNPLPSLVLPSIHTIPASPVSKKASLTATARHPNSSSSRLHASGSGVGRSPSPATSRQAAAGPKFNLPRCKELVAIHEDSMALQTNTELEVLRQEMQKEAVAASTHLTRLLESKETLSGQNDTYNAMIQDLAVAAQKMRSSTSNTARKTSIRRPESTSRSALGTNSAASSRPSSPNPMSTSQIKPKSPMGSVAKDSTRRSSLW